MSNPSYATIADLAKFGFPRGLLANPAREIASIEATGNVLTLDSHGFGEDDVITFRAEDGGTLPSPLVAGTSYYAIPLTDSTFQVASSEGGSALDIASGGERVLVAASTVPMLEALLEQNSRLFDSYLPAHAVPLEEPYPTVAIACVAQLTAADALALMGQSSELIQARAEQTRKELSRLAKGIPLRDERATAPSNLATTATISASRGWGSCSGGTIP